MLQPLMLRLTRNAAAFAAARPTLLFKPLLVCLLITAGPM